MRKGGVNPSKQSYAVVAFEGEEKGSEDGERLKGGETTAKACKKM